MNFQEIISTIKKLGLEKDDFEDLGEFPELGKHEQVYQKGSEGEGDHYEIVRYFEDYDIFIRLQGYYTSYDGVSYDSYDYEEVLPHQEVITVYR